MPIVTSVSVYVICTYFHGGSLSLIKRATIIVRSAIPPHNVHLHTGQLIGAVEPSTLLQHSLAPDSGHCSI